MKTINIQLNIPDRYKWLAVQPWGEITLFANKPEIESPPDGYEFWSVSKDEASLTNDNEIEDLNKVEDWKTSLRPI